jgi:putative ABC transport system permease protein
MTLWHRLLRRRALERELDAELRDHIEREVADGVRSGQSDAEVRRDIRLRFGGLDQVKEACRDVRRPRALADIGTDLRVAWRVLVKDRRFTAATVVTLALGIGATTAIFSVVYSVLIKPLPHRNAEELVRIRHRGVGADNLDANSNMYLTYRAENTTFANIGLWLEGNETLTSAISDPPCATSAWCRSLQRRFQMIRPLMGLSVNVLTQLTRHA